MNWWMIGAIFLRKGVEIISSGDPIRKFKELFSTDTEDSGSIRSSIEETSQAKILSLEELPEEVRKAIEEELDDEDELDNSLLPSDSDLLFLEELPEELRRALIEEILSEDSDETSEDDLSSDLFLKDNKKIR